MSDPIVIVAADQLINMIATAVQIAVKQCLGESVATLDNVAERMAAAKPISRAELLDMLKVHPSTLHRWEREGKLVPTSRIGRRAYYNLIDIENLARSERVARSVSVQSIKHVTKAT